MNCAEMWISAQSCLQTEFPPVLLLLLNAMQVNKPVSFFEIDTLTPGFDVFALSWKVWKPS